MQLDTGGPDIQRSVCQSEVINKFAFKSFHVPLVRTHFLAGKFVQYAAQNPADIILQNQLFLIYALQQLPPQPC